MPMPTSLIADNRSMGNRSRRTSITLLPMLCSKPSIKEVIVPKWPERRRGSDEPLSPRVGCMGQVGKIRSNSRVIAYPTPCPNRYLKFPNLLSISKNSGRRVVGNQIESISEMDPPLPVRNKKAAPELETLWKRRSKGTQLHIQIATSLPL